MVSKAIITKLKFPLDGNLHYNVQIVRSTDGKSFWYCGCGKFCRTKQEARQFIEESKESFAEVIDNDSEREGDAYVLQQQIL